jgi:hypothetical protein
LKGPGVSGGRTEAFAPAAAEGEAKIAAFHATGTVPALPRTEVARYGRAFRDDAITPSG